MKKILIVDDSSNNRMLVRAMLEHYTQEGAIEVTIMEAANGAVACTLVENNRFDLIFMDIMMPVMDGVEATRRIRQMDSKVMIIAVSAIDDAEKQKEILTNGAEDYLSKPLDMNIFSARLGNYFSLIDSRHGIQKRFNPSPANLFTSETFSRKLLFYIRNDDELAEFWEYYLLDQEEGSEELSDTVRTLYALGSVGVKLKKDIQIIVEDADEYLYMTMVGFGGIKANIIKLILIKNSDITDYKLTEDKLSIRVLRPKKVAPIQKSIVEVETPYLAPKETLQPVETLHVYDYMDEDDLDELKGYVGKLNSLMLIVGGEIDAHEVEEIAYNLQQISRITTGYTDSYRIGQALASMGNSIVEHTDAFMEKSRAIAPMCAAFGRDLNSWIRLIFSEGASFVNYMDDTIITNAQMIESILTMDDNVEGGEENLDDIFDF
ncbi:MAG: response regulator [Campylobacterales bacterium]|nr:response regulator [Campylobacterales bacterium]